MEDIILSETAIDFAMKAKNPLDRKSATKVTAIQLASFALSHKEPRWCAPHQA